MGTLKPNAAEPSPSAAWKNVSTMSIDTKHDGAPAGVRSTGNGAPFHVPVSLPPSASTTSEPGAASSARTSHGRPHITPDDAFSMRSGMP